MAEPRKKSIFAQRMHKRKEHLQNATTVSERKTEKHVFGDRSYIVTGEEAMTIHNENVNKLLSMSEEELLQEREKIVAELDPGIIKFLQSRRNKDERIIADVTMVEDSECGANKCTEDKEAKFNLEELNELKEIAYKYPHMDIVEDDKLKWIGELPKEVKIPKDPYPARFNFEGRLLPFCDKGEGVLQGLHNHGDEQERPGYSLQELIQLSRSSVLQQRVIAINTLANIMANASNYDECFDIPILSALLEADTFLLLRFSLDDPAQPVVSAAAAAICNLIVNHLDEFVQFKAHISATYDLDQLIIVYYDLTKLCLDMLLGSPLGIQQPSFGVALEVSKDDISELKDQELLKLDIIKGALRTDLLTRIKYILVDLSTEPVEIKHLLKTITRIARHSYETADIVFKCPGLLEKVRTLVDKGDEGSYFPEALKLFRILCARSKTFAAIIASDYRVLEAVFSFIAGDKAQKHPETMQLTLESFYIWQTFLNYDIALESIGQLTPVLLRLLDAHYGLTDISGANSDLEHGTALVSTLSCAAKLRPGVIAQAIPLLLNCTRKWLLQYEQGMSKSFQASKLVGAALNFFTYSFSDFDSSKELFPILESILNKSSITHTVQRLRKYSWLIRGKVMSCPENLPCLGSVPPTVQEESSFPFVYSLATYLLRTKTLKLIDSFINSEEVTKYIVEVLKEQNIRLLCGHWYARQEIYLLVQLVHLYIMAEIKENEAVYHKLAFTLLTSIQSGDKYLLSDIISKAIFNSKFFRPDVEVVSLKMQELCLENVDGIMKHQLLTKALEEIKEIEMCYTGELGLQGLIAPWPPVTLTGLLNSTQCALPSDWIFMPILRLYNNQSKDANSAQIAKRCLQWFIILEELFPEFSIGLTVTGKYSRLCCVYLAGNDLFRDVTQLLDLALHHIVKHSSQLDFEASIPGLTSFYDFYREVLEQFAFISYGDHVFGKYVLVPLAQRHDVKYKKLVWSELSAVLRALSTPVNCVNMELYFEPLETDFDLLMSYLRGLATGRIRECWCPILYKVAVHHVSRYVKENSDKSAQLLHSRIVSLGNQDLRELLLN